MTWSYASSDPGSSGKSYVRLRIGDTSSGSQLLSDEEIAAFLTTYPTPLRAAAESAFAVAAQFARRVDKTAGRMGIQNSQAAMAYERLGKRLLVEMSQGVAPYAGGISVSDKDSVNADTDRDAPVFSVGMNDFTGTVAPSTYEGLY